MTMVTVDCGHFLDEYAERWSFEDAYVVGEVRLLPRGSAQHSPLRASWRPYRMERKESMGVGDAACGSRGGRGRRSRGRRARVGWPPGDLTRAARPQGP